ncbi:ATP-binding protein [Okeania hirsuta]|uniref:ATP-binding protein n=1 Tax=Okeania hirsuta TaxID=1458930 RepID=A0A3N6P8D0_9CYAN|nr:NACHT domain-containing protein [Okeania hirsuta]RQH37026.1 ATP-binding protein [Okeania hirsuta]
MPSYREINNQKLLQKLVQGMEMSQGQFRLFLAQCNNLSQRDRLIPQLRESFSGDLAQLQLDESVDELYATIRKCLGNQQPDALMVWGLEFVRNIDKLLVAMSLVREEFRKNCPFPIVLWIDAEISRKFIRLIPDFENWSSLTVFETATQELIDFIQQTSESVYQKVLESGAGIFLDDTTLGLGESAYQELVGARQELLNREVTLEPELEANLEFVLGRATDNSTEVALEHYQHSLELWQQVNNSMRVAHTYYYLGLWWRSYAVSHRVEKNMACERACSYFQQSVEGFETINRPDLVAKFINTWGEVLQTLGRWDELETVANRAIELHQTYSQPFCEARAYGFLAEFELAKNHYRQAKKLAQNAIKIFNKTLDAVSPPSSEKDEITLDWERYSHLGKYLFALAKAEKYLGKFEASIANFEQAKNTTKPEYSTEFYIDIITESREIYYQQKAYLAAFELKQKLQQIEQQFGFVAFIGANRLGYRKPNTNPALPQLNRRKVTQEISASGRKFNVEELLERISRPDYKLIVIHGQSGVGKSSILQAGLITALEKKSIDTRNLVVVLQQVYIHWISALGESLAKKLKAIPQLAVNSHILNSTEAIFSQLRNNAELNLLTVIIFDQFEEFFFVNSEPVQKREFAQFLEECLKIPFVKIVLSLRSDYIHYLLEFNYLANLETISNDILSKNVLYELRNFSQDQAKLVIQGLTENSQFKIDPNLTEKLVEDLAQELGEIRPIELQVVGAQLQTENITTVEKYQELGDYPKAELVNRYLASVVKDCGEENEKFAWLVLILLTDENNTRPLKTQAELVKESEFQEKELELVLKIFVKSSLVFLLREKPANRYQLVHDYLVAFIRQRKGNETLEELKQEREKRQQLQKWVVRGSVAAALVMTVLAGGMTIFGLWAQKEKIRAERQTTIAQASEARALSISGERWDGLMTAMEARQKQRNSKFQPTDDASKVTNALRVAVYKRNKEEFRDFNPSAHLPVYRRNRMMLARLQMLCESQFTNATKRSLESLTVSRNTSIPSTV